MVRVGWIFSLVRSGSSALAYASAAPWKLAVADEPFGPWDRTGPPYNLPPIQRDLVRAFVAVGHTLTAEIVGMANELFRVLAERDDEGRVICKCPHLLFDPDQFETWFGGSEGEVTHRQVALIRNPLHRVNSAYTRGWEQLLNDPYELEVYRTFLSRWQRTRNRFVFDQVVAAPEPAFQSLYDAFDFGASTAHAAAAAEYLRTTYHASSAERSSDQPNARRSESGWNAPADVADVYLADEQIAAFMKEQGWPTRRSAYLGTPIRAVVRTLLAK